MPTCFSGVSYQDRWTVQFHDAFDTEFNDFSADVQDQLLATARVIQWLGPDAGRPHVANLANSVHPNMKELRFTAHRGKQIWRAAFAFDPLRRAIVLAAACKQGRDEKRFYRSLLRIANARFAQHLANTHSRS